MDEFQLIADSLVVYRLRVAWHEIARMGNEISSDYDATLSMGFILMAINEADGTPVTKIAPRMGLEPNSLSRVLKSMELKKLITRAKDEQDKRQVIVRLTDEGKTMREIALRTVFRLNNAIVKELPEEAIKGFFTVMEQIPAAIQRVRERMEEERGEAISG